MNNTGAGIPLIHAIPIDDGVPVNGDVLRVEPVPALAASAAVTDRSSVAIEADLVIATDQDILKKVELQAICLYENSTCKALVLPFSKEKIGTMDTIRAVENATLSTTEAPNTCRIKFTSSLLWSYNLHDGRRVVLGLIDRMDRAGKELLMSVNLSIFESRCQADTLFFDNKSSNSPMKRSFSTIALEYNEKEHINVMSLISVPENEANECERIVKKSWSAGIFRRDSSSIVLKGGPWESFGTNLESRRMMMDILGLMYSYGWKKVQPFDCSVTEFKLDNLLFTRHPSDGCRSPIPEICCISPEESHKIRLIGGAKDATGDALEQAVRQNWPQGVAESRNVNGTRQIKCRGSPWDCRKAEDAHGAANVLCGAIEAFSALGWKWHCALGLSLYGIDRSTIFFCRDDNSKPRKIKVGCMQRKNRDKVHFTRFPPRLLNEAIEFMMKSPLWAKGGFREVKKFGAGSATIKFAHSVQCPGRQTCALARHVNSFILLLNLILGRPGVELVGCADISGLKIGEDNDLMNMDAFFFSFRE